MFSRKMGGYSLLRLDFLKKRVVFIPFLSFSMEKY